MLKIGFKFLAIVGAILLFGTTYIESSAIGNGLGGRYFEISDDHLFHGIEGLLIWLLSPCSQILGFH